MPEFASINGAVLHYRYRPGTGRPILFLNSLGTDLRIWDAVVAQLPASTTILLMDKRGHGLSETAPADMATYAADAAGLLDRLGLSGALVCGVSVGGMIAQRLALSRPDLVHSLVLSNTGAKIGDAEGWDARIAALHADGLEAMADTVLERWFSPSFRANRKVDLAGYRAMLVRTPPEGYATCCTAIRDTDLRDCVTGISVPTICLAGTADLSTPPALLADLTERLPQAELHEIKGAGHLPCIETPERVASAVRDLMDRLA